MNKKSRKICAILLLLCLCLAECTKVPEPIHKIAHKIHHTKHHDKKNEEEAVVPQEEVPGESDEGHPDDEPEDPGFVDEETDAPVEGEDEDEGHPDDEPEDPGFIDEDESLDGSEEDPDNFSTDDEEPIIDDEEEESDDSDYKNMDEETKKKKVKGLVEFLKGFFKGFVGTDIQGLEECPIEGFKMMRNFDIAVHHFHSKDPKTLATGFKYLLKVIEEAPVELSRCEGVRDTVMHASQLVLSIVNPANIAKILGKNLIFKGPKIVKYVKKGVQAEKRHDMYHFGYYVGIALNKLIG